MKLDGHSAIVTGGASGLGLATAKALSEAGVKVAVWDLKENDGDEHASALGGVFCKTDVSSEDGVIASLDKTIDAIGTPRILVNCAGIGVPGKTVGRDGPHSYESFKAVINVNLLGTFNCIRLFADKAAALDPLEDGERGVIVNTASVAAFEGQIGQASYSASKGGVVGMTLPIARDLMKQGIRCNTIAPGLFDTPLVAMMPANVRESLSAQVPFPSRFGKPSEYASLALEIVRNTIINGETIRLDGAIRMQPR